jgi:outer membrane protein assembly factor BamB
MKKAILRNIAIVSAIFIATFSIMLMTNYFQIRGVNPLQSEVIETLRQINDENAGNTALQEQIRQLDLLARKAYFIRIDHLMTGVYILIAALLVFVIALRYYYAGDRNIPAKQITPVDEWLIKTNARRYISLTACALVVAALTFALLSAPHISDRAGDKLKANAGETAEIQPDTNADADSLPELPTENAVAEAMPADTVADSETAVDTVAETDSTTPVETASKPAASEQPTVPKTSHNGFRGNNSNAVSAARGIPVKWDLSTGENIAWQSEVPRHGYNSPVISGNKVFVSGADEQARELYCYDLNTGEHLWTLQANDVPGSPAKMPETTSDTGLAASTVATNGRQVCAIFASGDLICADMDGKRIWAKNLGVPENHYGYASSLLAYGNSLIVQYDNSNAPRIMAFNMATGDEQWSRARQEKITWSSPIIAHVGGKPQLVLMGNPAITAYNPDNGEQYWRVEGLNGEVAASPCSAEGIVFGASEYASLIAVDAATGETLWTADEYLPEVSSPVATRENVYVATSYGVLACYDAKTGELKHSHELNTEFYSSPVVADGKLYLFSNNGELYIYSTNNECTLLNSFDTGQKTLTTPAFTDGRIVVRSENGLYCVTENKKT